MRIDRRLHLPLCEAFLQVEAVRGHRRVALRPCFQTHRVRVHRVKSPKRRLVFVCFMGESISSTRLSYFFGIFGNCARG